MTKCNTCWHNFKQHHWCIHYMWCQSGFNNLFLWSWWDIIFSHASEKCACTHQSFSINNLNNIPLSVNISYIQKRAIIIIYHCWKNACMLEGLEDLFTYLKVTGFPMNSIKLLRINWNWTELNQETHPIMEPAYGHTTKCIKYFLDP